MLLGDTLLSEFPSEEVKMVVAHELGHQAHRHLEQGLLLGAVWSGMGFWILKAGESMWAELFNAPSISHFSFFPGLLLLGVVVNSLTLPFQNGLSRHWEYEADRFALLHGGSVEVFASLMKRLAGLNLADVAPPRWIEFCLHDHPSIQNRIRHALVS